MSTDTQSASGKKKNGLPQMAGLRLTRQRQEVYRALMKKRDHPTASELFVRVKDTLPTISLATVYNCLEALVEHRLVRQVNFEREPSRFCPNLVEHGHFMDESSGMIYDVVMKENICLEDFLSVPEGACVTAAEFTLKGVIASRKP